VADLRARALIQRGDYSDALALAGGALTKEITPALCAALHEDIGVAACFVGDGGLARRHLKEAERLLGEQSARPREFIRLLSYQGINEYRHGQLRSSLPAIFCTDWSQIGQAAQCSSRAVSHQPSGISKARARHCHGPNGPSFSGKPVFG
jgi:hypothetical protein